MQTNILSSLFISSSVAQNLYYLVTLTNIGVVELDIAVVDFILNGQLFNLIGELQSRKLQPGENIVVEPKAEVDICGGGFQFDAQLLAKANTPYGNLCEAKDR